MGGEQMFEAEAEAAYVEFKRTVDAMSWEAREWFWLKVLWYAAVKAPYSARSKVDATTAINGVGPKAVEGAMVMAHVHRPPWIRMIEPDDFDRGLRPERLLFPV